ncbi:EamA family transporter [Granulicatella sp. zg-ZJ]|uniref:DMT family transporter n=1 Tax=Granulicatella sp. zg-ZJ TaxID=2678504 RepID=UPI0013D1735F|nr:EamA family transporter [Granulicatella sp. zg-ZJ]NEW62140.1 EamA family transporter [Granulicatella sp. zg-ZJ]
MKSKKYTLMMISSMTIFGTIGVFRRYITLPSSLISLGRGFIAVCCLCLFLVVTRKPLNWRFLYQKRYLLLLSGALIGFNWILLFEALQYTTVATATVCYYMAPIFVLIASPFVLKERLNIAQCMTILVALCGMICVSGVFNTSIQSIDDIKGILCGLMAAMMYATVIMLNKKMSEIDAYDKTMTQLSIATLVLFPYVLCTENLSQIKVDTLSIVMLLLLGVLHTGIAYAMYFGAINQLPAQTVALLGYIDPVVAVFISSFILKEHIGLLEYIGAALILGSMMCHEYISTKNSSI